MRIFSRAGFILLALVLLAFFVRGWGMTYGIPQQFIGDEFVQVAIALTMLSEKAIVPNFPDIFYHQPLSAYISLIGIGTFLLFQIMRGAFGGIAELADFYAIHASELLVVPRFISALLGALTVVFVYYAARDFFSKRVGILSSLFVAISFSLSYVGHSGRVWGYMPFFIALALLASVKLFLHERARNYIFAGGASLLAAANLLPGVFTLLPSLVARFSWRNKNMWYMAGGLAGGILGIILMNPRGLGALLFRFQSLSGGRLIEAVAGSPITYTVPTSSLLHRLFDPLILLFQYDPLITIFGIIGMWLLWREDTKKFFFLGSFLVAYYLFIGPFFSFGWVVRTLGPLTIYLAISAAYGISKIAASPYFSGRKIFVFLVCLVCAPSLLFSVVFSWKITRDDTRIQGIEWIKKNLPEHTRILAYSLTNEVIPQDREVLELMRGLFPSELNTRQRTLLASPDEQYPAPRYFAWDLRDIGPDKLPQDFFIENNFAYYLRTVWNNGVEEKFFEEMRKKFKTEKLVASFSPVKGPLTSGHQILSAHNMMYPLEALFRAERFGPVVELYEISFK